mgnify:CR=1 FL=1
MLDKKLLEKLSIDKIEMLIEKKRELKKFKTVRLLKEELERRKENPKEEKRKRKKAGSLLSKEKLFEEERTRRAEKRKQKKENKDEVQKSKLTREMKTYISQVINEMKQELVSTMEETFKQEIKKLKKDGLFYGCEYLALSSDEIANRGGIKKIGEKGWVYSFELNGKMIFMRMVGGKKDE